MIKASDLRHYRTVNGNVVTEWPVMRSQVGFEIGHCLLKLQVLVREEILRFFQRVQFFVEMKIGNEFVLEHHVVVQRRLDVETQVSYTLAHRVYVFLQVVVD